MPSNARSTRLVIVESPTKAKKLGTGVGMASAALITLFFFTMFLFIALAELLNDLFWDDYPWAGYGVVAGLFAAGHAAGTAPALAEGVLKSMILTKMQLSIGCMVIVAGSVLFGS